MGENVATANQIDEKLLVLQDQNATDQQVVEALEFFILQTDNSQNTRIFMTEKVRIYEEAIRRKQNVPKVQELGE